MHDANDSAPVPTTPQRGTARVLVAAVVTAFAGLGIVAASTAMSAAPIRPSAEPPSPSVTPISVAPAPRAPTTTTVLLLVSSHEEAARITAGQPSHILKRSRGALDVQVAFVHTDDEERRLRSMLLSDAICPPGACGDLAIIDLRN